MSRFDRSEGSEDVMQSSTACSSSGEDVQTRLEEIKARAPLCELDVDFYVAREARDWPLSRREKENFELGNLVQQGSVEQAKYKTVLSEYMAMADHDEEVSAVADEHTSEYISTLERTGDEAARQIAMHREKISTQRQEIRALRKELRKKRDELADVAEERASLAKRSAELETSLTSAAKMAALSESMCERIAELKVDRREQDAASAELREEMKSIEERASALVAERSRAERMLAEMTTELDHAQSREAMYLAQEVLVDQREKELTRREHDVKRQLARVAVAEDGRRPLLDAQQGQRVRRGEKSLWQRVCFCY